MDLSRVDLNLLVVLDAMLKKRSVTQAGESIGLSQPAMSYALTKLRKLFNDPLFVKTPRGMLPTPLAQQLGVPLSAVLRAISVDVFQQSNFDPETTTRTFNFCMSDIGEMVFLPSILRRFKTVAPGANIRTLQVSQNTVQQMLESGEADLAVGYFPDLRTGFYQQVLSDHKLVCIVRADHPTIGDELTMEQFLANAHAVVNATGRSQEVVERALAEQGIKRRVLLDIPHYMVIPLIIQETDLIVTVPQAVADLFSQLVNIKVLPSPINAPTFHLKQHWHERYNNDVVNRWLRGQVAELFMGKGKWW